MRWNFMAALIDAAGWGLGFGFVSAATFLPLFVRQLTDAPRAIGLISTILALGWYLPGVLVAHRFERLPRVRGVVLAIAAIERLPLLLMALLVLALGPTRPALLLAAFFVCWGVMSVALGFNSPAYYTLIAKTIPATSRGRLYGLGGALAGLLGVAAGELAGGWLTRFGFPRGYALCFAAAFAVQTVSVIPLGLTREPTFTPAAAAGPPLQEGAKRGPSVKQWRRLLQSDRNLSWLVASHILYSASLMAAAFYTDYAIRHLGARPRDVGHFTSVVMAAQAAANLLCGYVADRSGNRRALQIATACGVAAAALAPIVPTVAWFSAIFALQQVAATGWGIASMNFVLELCGPERAGTYTALSTVLTGPFRAVMPMVGAELARALGFAPVFALAAGLTSLSLIALSIRVIEPRRSASTAPQSWEPVLAAVEGAE